MRDSAETKCGDARPRSNASSAARHLGRRQGLQDLPVLSGSLPRDLWLLQSGAAVLVACASLAISPYGFDVAKMHVPASDIRLTAPQLHDGFVTLSAINVGDAPGSLRPVTLESPYIVGSRTLTSATADEFVPVGGKRVSIRLHERPSAREERALEDQTVIASSGSDKPAGEIAIIVVGSDGKERFVALPIIIEQFTLHATDSDRKGARRRRGLRTGRRKRQHLGRHQIALIGALGRGYDRVNERLSTSYFAPKRTGRSLPSSTILGRLVNLE